MSMAKPILPAAPSNQLSFTGLKVITGDQAKIGDIADDIRSGRTTVVRMQGSPLTARELGLIQSLCRGRETGSKLSDLSGGQLYRQGGAPDRQDKLGEQFLAVRASTGQFDCVDGVRKTIATGSIGDGGEHAGGNSDCDLRGQQEPMIDSLVVGDDSNLSIVSNDARGSINHFGDHRLSPLARRVMTVAACILAVTSAVRLIDYVCGAASADGTASVRDHAFSPAEASA